LPWIVVWVWAMTGTVLLPIFRGWNQIWVMPLFVIFFIGGMIITLLIPLAQLGGMSECRTFETEVSSELSEPITIALSECRRRSNIYEEFGPWKISSPRN
jgi:hypothetical protein